MLQQWPDLSRRTVEDTANVIAGMKVDATEDATLDALADPSAAGSALLDTSSRRRRTEHSLRKHKSCAADLSHKVSVQYVPLLSSLCLCDLQAAGCRLEACLHIPRWISC